MASNGKSSPFDIGNGSLSGEYCGDTNRYKEKKYSRTLSLQNLSSLEKQANIFNKTFSDYERSVQGQESTNVHYNKLTCDVINEAYARNNQPMNEASQRFSPQSNYQSLIAKSSEMKKGEVLKEQTNHGGVNEIWQQQKKYRLSHEHLRGKKSPHSLSGSAELFANQFLPQDGAVNLGSMHGVARDYSGMLQSYRSADDQLLDFSTHSSAACASPGVKSMQIGKTYGGAAPLAHSYPTDLSCAGLNMCGGDSLMRSAMTHNETGGKWDQLNRKYYTEKKYDEQRAAALKSADPKVLSENAIVAMNVSAVSSSPAAKDLSQHSVNSSGSVNREDNNIKGFSLVSLPPHLQEARHVGVQDAPLSREPYNTQGEICSKEKRYNIPNYKHPVWGNFDSPHFAEQPQQQGRPHHLQNPYDASYCSDCHSTPHVSTPYDMNPLFLKDHSVAVKQELRGIHSGTLPMSWEKGPGALLGTICKPGPDRESFYMKPPPVDLDDLSEDERERMRVKRERNRVAAAKCRNRRRELLERLEKEAEQLEREQEVLRDNVKRLQAQKRKLGSMLDKHEPACSNKIEETPNPTYTAESEMPSEPNVAE